jgi:hypothetical protein
VKKIWRGPTVRPCALTCATFGDFIRTDFGQNHS